MAVNSRIYVRKDEGAKWLDISGICTGFNVAADFSDGATKVSLQVLLLGSYRNKNDPGIVVEGYLREVLAQEFVELHRWPNWLRRLGLSICFKLRSYRRRFRLRDVEVTALGSPQREYLRRDRVSRER